MNKQNDKIDRTDQQYLSDLLTNTNHNANRLLMSMDKETQIKSMCKLKRKVNKS